MRDIALFVIVFGLLPFILRHSYIGVLAWSWLSYMNPHRLTWGAAYNFPFAQLVAITLFVSLLFNKDKKEFPVTSITVTWIIFLLWTLVTSAMAIYPDDAWSYELQVFKIQLILFISLWMMGGEDRIKMMIWTIFFSVGFFGIKGGVFTLSYGGTGRVWGPAGSFIADNNHLAVALLMVVPLGFYLLRHEIQRKRYKWGMGLCILLIVASVIGSFSRGAFLAIGVTALYMWFKSPGKIVSGTLGAMVLVLLAMTMPSHWTERMETITEYKTDGSAVSRINSWQYAINLANDRFTGGGYDSWSRDTFARWAPNPDSVFVAHSIYFAVLADHGWVGLILFLLLFSQGWFLAGRISRHVKARGSPEDQWMAGLANAIKISWVAYASGGAFLSLAYFDLPWHMLAIIVLLDMEARKRGIYPDKVFMPGAANAQHKRLPV